MAGQPQTLIDVLWNGAIQVRKGVEVTAFLQGTNNVIKLSNDVAISINKKPFVIHYHNEILLIDPTFVYLFAKDMTMSEGITPAPALHP